MILPEGKTVSMENRVIHIFSELRKNKRKGLITYITAGYPNLKTSIDIVFELENSGADIVELGVPYSDPLADGPVIQKASAEAIKGGTTLKGVLEAVAQIRLKSQIPLVLMTYINPVYKYGIKEFAKDAASAGVDGLIIPDLPMEESTELEALLQKQNICLIPLVAPTSGEERIKKITSGIKGFIYCVSVTGVTGIRHEVPKGLEKFLHLVRDNTNNPLGVGFGVADPEQAHEIAKHCDAVIVGSALVKTIDEHKNSPFLKDIVKNFISNLKKAL